MKAYFVQLNVAFYRCLEGLPALITNVHGFGQKVQNPACACHGTLEQVNHLGKACQRPEQALGQEYQHAIGTHVQAALEGHHAAHRKGGQEAGEDSHPDDRNKRGTDTDGSAIGLYVGFAALLESFGFPLFGGKALDGGNAAQVVRQTAGQVAHFFPTSAYSGPALRWK